MENKPTVVILKPDTIIHRNNHLVDPKVSVRLSSGEALLHGELFDEFGIDHVFLTSTEDRWTEARIDDLSNGEFYDHPNNVVIMLCGIAREGDKNYEESYRYFSNFKGRKYYILTDYRRDCWLKDDMLEKFDCPEKGVTILCQGLKNSSAFSWNIQSYYVGKVTPLELFAIPMAGKARKTPIEPRPSDRAFRMIYTAQNFNLNGDYRNKQIAKMINDPISKSYPVHLAGRCSDRESMKAIFIKTGDRVNLDNYTACEPVLYEDMQEMLRYYKYAAIISEYVYESCLLIPNRVFEAIISGCIPHLITDDVNYMASLYDAVKDSHRDMKEFIWHYCILASAPQIWDGADSELPNKLAKDLFHSAKRAYYMFAKNYLNILLDV